MSQNRRRQPTRPSSPIDGIPIDPIDETKQKELNETE
jgi:hypothetical protein